jgi:hypothetical protein
MAEDEIIKHTKKIYKTWFSKDIPVWHKISEFLVEILIIVFAVSVSIWFHNRSEHSHQQQEAREFLDGLKADLTHDIKEMYGDMDSYEKQRIIFNYIAKLKLSEVPNKDTLNKYGMWILNSTMFAPNDGRFQGFKSSGKIGTIENIELQNDILDLYQENIPALLASSQSYIDIQKKVLDYLLKNKRRLTDSTNNFVQIINSEEFVNIAFSLASPVQVLERYAGCIQLMHKIIGEIDKE